MNTFLAMGGYGAFVWPAYGASALVLIAAIILTVKGHAQARAQLRRLENEQ